jgi:hypothetical protein
MTNLLQRRIWLYCHDEEEAEWAIKHRISDRDYLVGISCQTGRSKTFPHNGLIPAMQAAIRGDIDLLMVANFEQLGEGSARIEEFLQILGDYGVSVKSFSNNGSSNS